jgi:hypothetical protein
MKSIIQCLLILLVALGFAAPIVAQDLSDNETCMECHADADRAAPSDPNMPQVHNPEGGFFQEAHEMWSCVDCHTYIEEIPHADGVADMSVDCLNCHEEVPQK